MTARTTREFMLRQVLEAIDGTGAPLSDEALPYWSGLPGETCHSLIREAQQRGFVTTSPVGWILVPAGGQWLQARVANDHG